MKPWIAGLAALTLSAAVVGAAVAQPGGGGNNMVRKACQADIEQLCGNTEPGGGRIGQCLRAHLDRLSDACKSALADARAARRQHGGTTPPPAPQSPAPAPN